MPSRPVAQVGVFAMGEEGLAAVENPSEMFLSERSSGPGVSSAVTVTLEGTRPLLLEVQALCSPTHQVSKCVLFISMKA